MNRNNAYDKTRTDSGGFILKEPKIIRYPEAIFLEANNIHEVDDFISMKNPKADLIGFPDNEVDALGNYCIIFVRYYL